MKKICIFLFIGFFLALMVSLLGATEEEQKTKAKFTINVSGLLASISQGYDFDFSFGARGEIATWTETVANVGSAFGFDVGVGIYPIPQLEIYVSYNSYGGNGMGGYTLNLPHFFLWLDEPSSRHTIANVENEFKASAFNLGLAGHLALAGKIKPYFGIGVSSVTVKVDLLDTVKLNDIIDVSQWWDSFDPYYWYEVDETIEITSVGFTQESETVWGFHAKVGVNVEVAKSIGFFVEARYLSTTVKFERPDITFKTRITENYYENYYGDEYEFTYTETDMEEFDVDDELDIKVGGVQGIIGIKFTF